MAQTAVLLCLAALGLALRWGTAQHPYSGAQAPPKFGDFEAQRHWMEACADAHVAVVSSLQITVHLPPNEWYQNSTNNNLLYWGLDYPPLTAYVSWLCGAVAHYIDPSWVALGTSHGIETPSLKLFMRASVLVCDLLVFLPALAWALSGKPVSLLLAVISPALILVDHGHFQYNNLCLGLSLAAFVCMHQDRHLTGAVLFVAALNFKQMALYYAVPVFVYLLGQTLRSTRPLLHLVLLGSVVLGTFAALLAPIATSTADVLQVIHRVFPVARGLFEDKVANFWCSISVVFKVRELFDSASLVRASLALTLLSIAWPALNLLRAPSPRRFWLALFNVAMAFFLFSFHVHEKTILFPLLPVLMLTEAEPMAASWFSIVATFSLWPLLAKDQVLPAYVALMLLQIVVSAVVVWRTASRTMLVLCWLSLFGCLIIHVASIFLPPPVHLPDLYPVLTALYSCGHFVMAWLYFLAKQWSLQDKLKDE